MSNLSIALHSHTLEETARALHMSKDSVRKTEIRALAKLRNHPDVRRLAGQAGILRESEVACASN